MDMNKCDEMKNAEASSTSNASKPCSEINEKKVSSISTSRRPRVREITSRFMSPANSLPKPIQSPDIHIPHKKQSPYSADRLRKSMACDDLNENTKPFDTKGSDDDGKANIRRTRTHTPTNNNTNNEVNMARRSIVKSSVRTLFSEKVINSSHANEHSSDDFNKEKDGIKQQQILKEKHIRHEELSDMHGSPSLEEASNLGKPTCQDSVRHPMGKSLPRSQPPIPPPRTTNYRPSISSISPRESSLQSVYVSDDKRGKKGASQEEIHQLRLLNTRLLQWRFVNAKAQAKCTAQCMNVQRLLYNAWHLVAELQKSVACKRTKLQKHLMADRLKSVLSSQGNYLEDWTLMDKEHIVAVSAAIDSLKSATLRVPIIDCLKVELHNVTESMNSAVEVIENIKEPLYIFFPKIEELSKTAFDLASIALEEQALLSECRELLIQAEAFQVEEASLRSHIIQLKQESLNKGSAQRLTIS